jgi:mannitol operon transcriptional antiterminator
MEMSMLTTRMQTVILKILESRNFITLQQIAEASLVSTRTILRELEEVSDWIEARGGKLDKRKGKGLIFYGDESKRKELIECLFREKSDVVFTPLDRQMILKAELLKTEETTKLFTLTKLFNVTESTIGSDLSQLDEWFNKYSIHIIRRPGLGVIIEGDEASKRRAIVALIYEHFQVIDLIEFISEHKSFAINMTTFKENMNATVLELLEPESLDLIKLFLSDLEKDLGYQFADNGYIALVIRFSITFRRSETWGKISVDDKIMQSLYKDRLTMYFEEWMNRNPNTLFSKLPYEEKLLLIMHIKGTKLSESDSYNRISMIEDIKIIQLVKEFIQRMENETGLYLTDNEKLLVSLVKHLRPAIYRMKMDLDIINPLLDEIKTMYPKLFQSVKESVSLIELKEKIKVPDDEVGYLAIHIGAIIQKEYRDVVKKYQIVVACMYGIGASQLLVSQIEKQFPNVHVIKVMSVIDFSIDELKEEEVDLLITTIPIKGVTIPMVVINQMLRDEDFLKIQTALSSYKPNNRVKKNIQKPYFRDKLLALQVYSNIIIELLDNLTFQQDIELQNIDELIPLVSESLAQNKKEVLLLSKAFKEREEKGSTILSKKGMMLLHCRADISRRICVQIVYLNHPIYIEQPTNSAKVKVIMVMVAPLSVNQKVLEVLSEINRSIITGTLADIICQGNPEDILIEINEILEKFYQKRVMSSEE